MADTNTIEIKYYYSDPGATNPLMHHYPIPTWIDIPEADLPWHWYKAPKPSDSMTDPVYDPIAHEWHENDKNSQTQIIANLNSKMADLNKKSEELDKQNEQATQSISQANTAVETIKANQKQAVQQSTMLTKQMGNMMKMMQMMQQTLTTIAKPQAGTDQPAKPETSESTQITQASESESASAKAQSSEPEQGGNK